MSRVQPIVVVIAMLAAGCGGGKSAHDQPPSMDSRSTDAAPPLAPFDGMTVASPRSAEPAPSVHVPPLAQAERRQLRMLAASITDAVDRFDATSASCGASSWASCLETAWPVLVGDLDWPPYYLRLFGARRGDCESLSSAVNGVYGFNLGARQLDYGDPDIEPSSRRSGYLTLADRLRPVPSELLAAAASGCR